MRSKGPTVLDIVVDVRRAIVQDSIKHWLQARARNSGKQGLCKTPPQVVMFCTAFQGGHQLRKDSVCSSEGQQQSTGV